ncbi:MAG: TatD family hydrolase [Crenarchaeota archaeon]|nr:TatD family hydrolase [Thermoproteota archaeon]
MLVDVHCHLHEYGDGEIEDILSGFNGVIVAVSDDYESSLRTLALAEKHPGRIIPCLGLHPWEVKGVEAVEEAERIASLIVERGVPCIGEVGLDKKFCPDTIEVQRRVFEVFLRAAVEADAFMNIHSPGAWGDVLALLREHGVERANFHWYTGPLAVLDEIVSAGYTVSINPAVRIQVKHQRVVVHAPLHALLTESDAPYEYRGMRLSPLMIGEVVNHIARLKGVDPAAVEEAVEANFRRVLRLPPA